MGGAAVLVTIWGIIVTVFWMVVGWRAMRAHERIAEMLNSHLTLTELEKTWACPKCKTTNPNSRNTCRSCGYKLE